MADFYMTRAMTERSIQKASHACFELTFRRCIVKVLHDKAYLFSVLHEDPSWLRCRSKKIF